jgi:hypothetical protein
MSFKKLVILRVFAMDYHSGQASRGYLLLCKSTKRLERIYQYKERHPVNIDSIEKAARRTKLYKDLVDKYGDKI